MRTKSNIISSSSSSSCNNKTTVLGTIAREVRITSQLKDRNSLAQIIQQQRSSLLTIEWVTQQIQIDF